MCIDIDVRVVDSRLAQDMNLEGAPLGREEAWAVQNIDFNRLYVTELQHVAQGSWQPVLYYKPF